MSKVVGVLLGFLIGAATGGVFYDRGIGIDLVPFLFGIGGAVVGLAIASQSDRKGDE